MSETHNYISRRQAAKSCGISGSQFNYIINKDPFKEYLKNEYINNDGNRILVNTNVIPLISEYYRNNTNLYHYYDSNPDYLSASNVSIMLNVSYRELVEEIRSGKWSDIYVEVPKCGPTSSKELGDIKSNYFFNRFKFLQGKYNTLENISRNTSLISLTQLRNYHRRGLLPQPEEVKNTKLFVENEILELIPTLKLQIKEEQGLKLSDSVKNGFNLLSPNQQKIISKYLDYRSNGGIVRYNGYSTNHQIANLDKTINDNKRKICSAFILIISGRCGIEEDFHKNPLHKNKTPKAFNPNIFDIQSVKVEDYFFISSKRKGNTLIGYYQQLKPFYYYLLDELEEDALDDPNAHRLFLKQKRNIDKFLNQFPRNDSDLKDSEIKHRIKTFLTREQMVLIKQLILEDVRSKYPIKYATMWQLSCSTGVRPEELHRLEISHFYLDENGYLQTDKDGWGLPTLPAEIAKQERSPSHPEFHTPIPKDTVKQLNQYLTLLYKRQGEQEPRGEGYLFRPDDAFPYYRYKKPIRFDFVKRLRSRLDFIDEASKQDFIFKASRHSLNNTIMRTHINTDTTLNYSIKQTAADHQLRHKPSRSVGEKYYMADIEKEQFYEVLDATINFPWDIEKLHEWEEKMGYRIPEILNINEIELIEEFDEETKELQEQLLVIEEQLQKLKEKPRSMTEQQWIASRQQLIKTKNSINLKLRGA